MLQSEHLYIRTKSFFTDWPRRYVNNFALSLMNADSISRIESLKKYLLEEPKDSFLRYALAMEYVHQKDIQNARLSFVDLLNEDPDYLAVYYQFAKLLEESGENEQALEIYRAGIKIAEKQNNTRTIKELNSALLSLLENEDETE